MNDTRPRLDLLPTYTNSAVSHLFTDSVFCAKNSMKPINKTMERTKACEEKMKTKMYRKRSSAKNKDLNWTELFG